MRNRIYITSIIENTQGFTTENAVINKSANEYKNVLIFVPWLHALFFNGKRYGSMNEYKNDSSVNSVFKLSICTEKNINSIRLAQAQLTKEFDATSILISAPFYVQSEDGYEYEIHLNIGDRAQIFLDYRSEWYWSYEGDENPIALVDKNHIVHGIRSSAEPQIIKLHNSSTGDDVFLTLKVYVYNSENNMYDILYNTNVGEYMKQAAAQGRIISDYDSFIREFERDYNSDYWREKEASAQNAEEIIYEQHTRIH